MVARLSVVIRSFNEERHIGRLLTGIVRQTVPSEIVLVDSGSTDATVAIATRYPVKVVTIRPDEFTFGRSLNRGVEATTGDIVVMASAHVYPRYDDWLAQLVAPFAEPAVALTYGKQRGNEVSKFSEHQIFRAWFPDHSNPNQTTPFCNNANAAIRRALWTEMPYDETLTGLEDIDWGRRVLERKLRIAYVAEAEVAHVHEETPSRIYNRYRREAMALKNIFPEERFGLRDFLRLFPSNTLSDIAVARNEGHLERVPEILMFRLMQFWGTYRGSTQRGGVSESLRRRLYYPSDAKPRAEDHERNRRRIDYSEVRR